MKLALPVAFVERFGGIADFPDSIAIKCAFCDCCANTVELPMPAEVMNNVSTVAMATTGALILIDPVSRL